ncbi:tetratricopeptide repeat protein [Cryomorphaceae bacterium]|nr:tetratricopeptide repeat protein [Cryomorphaceae bacterium]
MSRIVTILAILWSTWAYAQSAQELGEIMRISDSLTRYHPQEFIQDWGSLENRPVGASDSLWAQFRIQLGYAYFYTGSLDSALSQFQTAVDLIQEGPERARMYNNIGAVLTRMERPREALMSYQNSLELRREFSDSVGTAKTLNNMGVLLRKTGDYQEAQRITWEAIGIYEALRDTYLLGETYNNLGLIYKEQQRVDSAKFLFETALEYKIIGGNKRSLASTYLNLGILNHEAFEYEQAEVRYRRAVQLRAQIGDQYGLTSALGNLAELYIDLERPQEAEEILNELLELVRAQNYKPFEARTLKGLARVYEMQRLDAKAYEFLKAGYIIQDSINDADERAEIKKMQVQFERDQVVMENERLRLQGELQETELRNQNRVRRIYIALIALLVFFGLVIGSLYRRQRQLNAKLKLSDQRYRELSNAPFIAIYLARNGTILESNSEFERLIGSPSPASLQEKDLLSYSFESSRTKGLINPIKGGLPIPVDVYHKRVELSDGPARIVALRDRREQERAEQAMVRATEEAMASERSKTEFLANMSHEIRTPMNGIIAAVDLLKKSEDKKKGAELIDLIEASTHDLMQTLNDILDLSKVEAGKVELEHELFDLKKAFSQSFTLFQFKAEQKGLEFGLIFEGDLPAHVIGDALRLRQVAGNFLSNAVKFTEQGSVHMLVRGEHISDRRWRIHCEVVDSGIGIDEKQAEQIFEKFNQADSSTTREFGGSGLGLAIARSLSELMGGGVEVESEPGEGSTFRFWIEVDEAESSVEESGRTDESSDSAIFQGPVLVAEDNPVNQKIIEMALKNLGIEHRICSDGKAVLDAYMAGAYRVVLMDIQMPVMDGLEAHDRIRAFEFEQAMDPAYVVAMTANVMKEDRDRYKEQGLNDFLGKPFNLGQLTQLLQRVERKIKE